MASPANVSRPIVLKASRETIAIVVGATLVTFALSNAIHAHRGQLAASDGNHQSAAVGQDWTGELADVATTASVAPSAPFTSASLVVPRSELALPRMPVRTLVKLHGCEGSACMAKASTTAAPRRLVASAQRDERPESLAIAELAPNRTLLKREPAQLKPSLMSRINPLRHLPDLSTIKRPFAYAGDTVTGWFRRF